MRSVPVFQPALESRWSFARSQACQSGLIFAAHYPDDHYAAALAGCTAHLELWTNLPVVQYNTVSTSQATDWRAIPLRHVHATVGRQSGYSFSVRLKCDPESADAVYRFTYRVVHSDGKIEWLGSSSNDGQIHLHSLQDSALTIRQLVKPRPGTTLDVLDGPSCHIDHDGAVSIGTLAAPRREPFDHLSFSINTSSVQSGFVVERTKSTWCTSRRFQSLSEVSTEFGSNLLVLKLSGSSRKEVLILMPILSDMDIASRLVRGPCNGDDVNFELCGGDATQKKISIALGTVDTLQQTITACRSYAARLLRTSMHEPFGLGWSGKKLFDPGSSSSPTSGAVAPPVLNTTHEPECSDVSFYSDSTASEAWDLGLSTSSSAVLAEKTDSLVGGDQSDASTADDDRVFQAGSRKSSLLSRAGLGFCTWEAMQNEKRRPYLSEVVAALEAVETRLGRGSVSALLIDDGWQDVVQGPDHRGRLTDFDMDPSMLDAYEATKSSDRNGRIYSANNSILARYVSHIRSQFPSIRSIGCWMTLAGYWDGIDPDGPIAVHLQTSLRHVSLLDPFRQTSRNWFIPATELDAHLFWDKAFYFLRECGIDFVKIDAQAEWEGIQDRNTECGCNQTSTIPARALGHIAFNAMEEAARRYFGAEGGVIHSMAFTAALTNTSRTLHSQGMTIRCTDDFFPEIPEAHRHHLAHNVYNSLLLPEHYCDADMLSQCTGDEDGRDYTGYHASFRAFTDAKLWISDKANARYHTSVRALVPPSTLRAQGRKVAVAAKGHLLPNSIFEDLIGDGVGPALKLIVRHENISSATLGLWNLRGGQANTFDLLDIEELQSTGLLGCVERRYAVTSFRTGRCMILDSGCGDVQTCESVLSAMLESGSWEVLTFSPLLSTSVEGLSVAMLGSTEHFLTTNGVHAFSITTSCHVKEGKALLPSCEDARWASHQHHTSSRLSSTNSGPSSTRMHLEMKDNLALTFTAIDSLMQTSSWASRAVLVMLALINVFFAILHATVDSVVRPACSGKRKETSSGKMLAQVDLVEAIISVIDSLQTLVVSGLLVAASWTITIPASPTKEANVKARRAPSLSEKRDHSDVLPAEQQLLKRVRLRPSDVVTMLKQCLASRTMAPLRDCFVPLEQRQQKILSHDITPPQPLSPLPEAAGTPVATVVATSLIDMAAKVSFLVLCPDARSIKTCTVDRTSYTCASTPWITIEPVSLHNKSAKVDRQPGSAFRLVVDMKAWVESQDDTYKRALSGSVSVSIQISASS